MITPEVLTVTKALRELASRVRHLELDQAVMRHGYYYGEADPLNGGGFAAPSSWTYVEGTSPVTAVGGAFRVDVEGIYLISVVCALGQFPTGRSFVHITTTRGRVALTPLPTSEQNASTIGVRHLLAGDVITPELLYDGPTSYATFEFTVTLLNGWQAPFLPPPAAPIQPPMP